MDNHYKELSSLAFASMHKEDVIHTILHYLKTKIPFDIFRASVANVNDNSIVNFINYESELSDAPVFYSLKNHSLMEMLEGLYGKDFSQVHWKSHAKSEHPGTKKSSHNKRFSSSISLCIDVNPEQKTYTYIRFSSYKSNAYSQGDAEFLKELRPVLQESICAYYTAYPEAALHVSLQGALPSNHLDQLKMCPELRNVVKQIQIISNYDSTVLLQGPTGSGKELVAGSIHALSSRKDKPFIAVNCGAIAESLMESELFGSEKGAYTSSVQTHKGYFEQAHKGTLYLDEIGELTKNAQKRLLRVLENHSIQRVGGEKTFKLDIRIIAATHRDLYQMVVDGTFREDLYYRLHVYPIIIKGLSARKKDIPILVEYFRKIYLVKFNIKKAPKITYATLNFLTEYPWHGNVRQLRYAVERAIIHAVEMGKNELDFSFLHAQTPSVVGNTLCYNKNVLHLKEIQDALVQCHGKIQGKNSVSELLQMHPSTLRSRMKALGIAFQSSKRKNK